MKQKLVNMEPITYDGHTFYPYDNNGEILCLPYDYKEYAKELLPDFFEWKIRSRGVAAQQYSNEMIASKQHADVLEATFGLNQDTQTPVKSFDEIYDSVVEKLLPEFLACKEVQPYILAKAKSSELPTYPLDVLLQLTYYADTDKNHDNDEVYEASL